MIVPAVLPISGDDLDDKLALFSRLPGVSRVQIDLVDGRFAVPAAWPYRAPLEMRERVARGELLPALEDIRYEIDLMCLDPLAAADDWIALGASRLTFHAESVTDLARFLAEARERYGCGLLSCDLVSIGLALSIETDRALIEPHLADIDYVQFMGIAKIGRQGQSFDDRVLTKIRIFREKHPEMTLQVDGGITRSAARALAALGVTDLVAGSSILRASDPAAAIEELRAACRLS